MNKTSIEWCTHTWNPIRARLKTPNGRKTHSGTFCTRISPGCTNCYASVINQRFGTGLEFTVPNLEKHEFYIDRKIIEEPLKRKKPATIFVGDMFDLFHEAIPAEMIVDVFEVMAAAEQHTFQVLTKRAHRIDPVLFGPDGGWYLGGGDFYQHIWLGVSIESRAYLGRADALKNWMGVRFLSIEPLLEDIGNIDLSGISWVIVGGESGPKARPFNLAWAESLLEQCRAAGVPFFMKQLGSNPIYSFDQIGHVEVRGKGGHQEDWPAHLRVREFPALH